MILTKYAAIGGLRLLIIMVHKVNTFNYLLACKLEKNAPALYGSGAFLLNAISRGHWVQQRIDLEQLCAERGLRITEQRRIIARVLSESDDHPDVELLHERSSAIDPKISIATVYRTVRLFEGAGILDRHDFGDGRARYEAAPEAHHDHLIDVETGDVVEFVDPELEALQKVIAEKLGYRLVDHRMELYGVKIGRDKDNPA